MRSAITPPTKKKKTAVQMYKMPIRLWSTVTSQDATRPLFHVTGYAASDLAATRARSPVDIRLQVLLQRLELRVRPVAADAGHAAAPVPHDRLERRRLDEGRVRGERGAVVALGLEAVTLCTDAFPLGSAELLRCSRRDEVPEVGIALNNRAGEHSLVVDPAELCALAVER